ncbi:MAG: beta-glycosidase, partial [Bacteroidales bacterium]|nr:beta-glycosidase [Bacteroidales bacterium]
MRKVLGILGLAVAVMACTPEREVFGAWGLCLDPAGVVTVDSLLGERADSLFVDTIVLPGTTDLAGKGLAAPEPQYGLPMETNRLTRRHSFVGKAWYRKKVVAPYVWREKDLGLYLERTKATKLYLDGALVDSCNDVSTPQLYNLGKLHPGVHTLMLCVDNGGGVPEQVIQSSHLYSDDTQTNWNGVIGRIEFGPMEDFSEKLPVAEMPRLEAVDGRFMAGGHPVFLRGKHDACVFPLTGHTPMDRASWIRYFQRCKEYGINHVRFHSWCPPEAAFSAADELGIYLQPELPFWGTLEGEELLSFLRKEGLNIVRTYGHHPSFAMFSLGNELWGEKSVMQEMVDTFRAEAPQILYTNGTNAFLGYQGYVEGMDFMATARTRGESYGSYDTHVRSSFAFCDALDGGILNHFYPGTTRNFAEALQGVPMPVISHETGQFQSYPDYAQIDKYTGPLAPYNLMEFRRRLIDAGLADQADDFHRASLRWAFELYKADVEICLRTPGLGGFQLLDLQDYPGQGSAYVGILDAFMDAKGGIDPAEWRQFCSELVPLAEFNKYCWSEDEVFRAHVKVANYTGEELIEGESEYEIDKPVSELLDGVKAPARIDLRLTARTAGHEGVNSWPIWVYPADNMPNRSGITIVRKLDKAALKALDAGQKVLLMPSDTTGTVGGLFQT